MAEHQVYLEDIEVGMELPSQEYGPWSNAHSCSVNVAQSSPIELQTRSIFSTSSLSLMEYLYYC